MNDSWTPGALFRGEFTQLVVQNLRWLAERQNADGGWSDAEGGRSNLAATTAALRRPSGEWAERSVPSTTAWRGGAIGSSR